MSSSSAPVRSKPTKRISFTLNNPAQSPAEFLEKFFIDERARFVCGQLEYGANGTPHIQGYAEFSRAVRFGPMASKYHMHCEVSKGDCAANRHYCSKPHESCDCEHCAKALTDVKPPEGYVEFGSTESSGKGKRSDLAAARLALAEGGIKRVAEDHLEVFVKYHRAFHELDLLERPSREAPQISLYFGPPGSGKTFCAENLSPNSWTTPPGWSGSSFWFDGLRRDSDVVVIDEFRGQVPLDSVLKLLNPRAQLVPIKGSHTWLVANTIVITTNVHPFYWYDWTGREMQYSALSRRIKHVRGFREFRGFDIDHDVFFRWRRPAISDTSGDTVVIDEYELIPTIIPNTLDDHIVM